MNKQNKEIQRLKRMTEEMIIDGVNVAGCGYYDSKNDKDNWCDLTCTREHAPFFRCESMPNCYYKQLQRLEQQNEKYKKALEEIRDNLKDICNTECDFHWCKGVCSNNYCDYYTNINKINEVLDERN